MTRITFYSQVDNRLTFAYRLVRKAYVKQIAMTIWGPMTILEEFSQFLWKNEALSFIPHCYSDSANAAATPIILKADSSNHSDVTDTTYHTHYDLLLNLGTSLPSQFARFDRLFEILDCKPEVVRAGRERYRFYRDHGYGIDHHLI